MRYKTVKIKSCPFCGKPGMILNNICENCGADISNRCAGRDCRRSLDASARYCKSCGEESIYFSKGLLRFWRDEYEERFHEE